MDVLDTAPDGNLGVNDVLADPLKTAALLHACYDELPAYGWTFENFDNIIVACTDDAWSPQNGGPNTSTQRMYNGQSSASSHPIQHVWTWSPTSNNEGYWWERFFKQIRKCTQVIELIDQSAASETNKRLYKAEAHVLRAWFYLELTKWYGKLPVLESMVAIDSDFSGWKREPVYNVVSKIIGPDCDAAIATAELPWRIDNIGNDQRVTKALAHAIKATAYLFAASPLHNEGNNYWEEVYQVCLTSVNELKANGYELFTECTEPAIYGTGDEAAFHQLVSRPMDYPQNRDRETIWQKRPNWGYGYEQSGYVFCYIGSLYDNTYSCSVHPTQELVDAFETRDGKPILDLRQPYLDEKHLQPNFRPGTGYNDQDPYVNRDPRFYATVLKNGDVITWRNGQQLTIDSYAGGVFSINFDINRWDCTRTGYFHRKLVVPGSSPTNDQKYATHKYYRLAEIILSFAEAAAEAGHLVEAKTAADEVRARVNMPPLPADLSKEDLILRIRNERRVELSFENQRYFDIRRWQKPDGNFEFEFKWATGMWIEKQPDGAFTYERVNSASVPRYGSENKYLLLPLSVREAALMESRTGVKWQNPGW
jgi:hypothetical protein